MSQLKNEFKKMFIAKKFARIYRLFSWRILERTGSLLMDIWIFFLFGLKKKSPKLLEGIYATEIQNCTHYDG